MVKTSTEPEVVDPQASPAGEKTDDVQGVVASIEAQAAAQVDVEVAAEAVEMTVLTPAQEAKRAAEALIEAANKALAQANEDLWLEETKDDYDTYLEEYTPAETAWNEAIAAYELLFQEHMSEAYALVNSTRAALDEVILKNPRSKPAVVEAPAKAKGTRAPKVDNGQNGAQSSESTTQQYVATLNAAQFDRVKSHPKFAAGATKTNTGGTVVFDITSRPRDLNYYAKHLLKASLGDLWVDGTPFRANVK